MTVDYLTVDYQMGQTPQDLSDFYNSYGAQGWAISSIEAVVHNQRRVVFNQAGSVIQYLVIDYPAGETPEQLTSDLNGYGASDWALKSTDLAKTNLRRAIFMKNGTAGAGGTDPNAMHWVPYVGPPQSFQVFDTTRDGDWTMCANKPTSTRPAPQQSGPEEDLLPAWVPTQQSARATYTMWNEWTVNTTGWIDQYGGTVLAQNTNALHTITLAVNGVVKDTFTSTPANPISYWHDITPILIASGAVIRVTVKVNQVGNNQMAWQEQAGLFATAPTYCSLAQGSKDGAAASSIAYDCHVQFIPGTASPDWDVVAFGGAAAGAGGAGGGIAEAPQDGTTYGRMNTAWNPALAKDSDTLDGGSF
jgi:hypothetical protein